MSRKGDKKEPISLKAKRDERADMDALAATVQDELKERRERLKAFFEDALANADNVIVVAVKGPGVDGVGAMDDRIPLLVTGALTEAAMVWVNASYADEE